MRAEHILVALRRRWGPLLLVPLTVVSGLGSRAVLAGLPAKVAGDALYTVLIYVLVLVVAPEARIRRAFGIALGVSFAVEIAQLTPYPAVRTSRQLMCSRGPSLAPDRQQPLMTERHVLSSARPMRLRYASPNPDMPVLGSALITRKPGSSRAPRVRSQSAAAATQGT